VEVLEEKGCFIDSFCSQKNLATPLELLHDVLMFFLINIVPKRLADGLFYLFFLSPYVFEQNVYIDSIYSLIVAM
jgi:hypothetical protein